MLREYKGRKIISSFIEIYNIMAIHNSDCNVVNRHSERHILSYDGEMARKIRTP